MQTKRTSSGKRSSTSRSKSSTTNERKVRYAVIGLGYIAQAAVLPAFKNAKNSELTAFISGDPKKLKVLGKKYDVKWTLDYEQMDSFFRSGEIDAVYIALPNHLHRSCAERAAEAGLHILCEKPLAPTVEDCEAMIAAAERSQVKLMTAYRLHFEEANLSAIDLIEKGKIGDIKYFESTFSMQVREGNIRTSPIEKGGGTLYDIGIYCINAARYLFQSEPHEVFAMSAASNDPRFKDIDETTTAILRFPGNRLATFTTSFGSADQSVYKVVGTTGTLEVENAYEWQDKIIHSFKKGDKKTKKTFPKRDQFAPELVYFSDCILKNKKVEPSGEEGLFDVKIIQALYESSRTGSAIQLDETQMKNDRPHLEQEQRVTPHGKAALIHVKPPSAA